MRSFFTALVTTLIIPFSGLLGIAHAAELNTPALQTFLDPSADYVCFVTNLNRKVIKADIELIASNGSVVAARSVALTPDGTGGILVEGTEALSARCRVTGTFPKNKVLVNMTLRDGQTAVTLVAVTGR